MSADLLRLLDWQVPPAHQRYTRRDTAFHALSVGAAADPLDARELHLVDPWSERLAALPSLALVVGYPGFWLGGRDVAEATGIEASRVLHVEQSVSLPAPLPVEADVIGETRVTALVDKGAGRGSLLYSERLVHDAASGALLATCEQVHYLRGSGGSGSAGQPRVRRVVEPSGDDPLRTVVQTSPQQALLYRLNGDANPLHIDPATARRAGFDRPILHGMCTVGMAVWAAARLLADARPERVKAFTVRMTQPVLPGEALQVDCWPEGRFRASAAGRDAIVLDDGSLAVAAPGERWA